MPSEKESLRLKTLSNLAQQPVEPLATLAEGLIPATDSHLKDLSGPDYKQIRERISSIIEQLLATDNSAFAVLNALVKIDEALAQNNDANLPFATRLTPLATACALRAQRNHLDDRQDQNIAEHSPIFRPDKRTLYAAPLSQISPDGLAHFIDRILKEVHRQKPKRVVLVLSDSLSSQSNDTTLKALASELAAQKVRLECLNQ